LSVETTTETKLATTYEAIRRREYELITDLLDVLPKIDTLSEDRVSQVRDALFHADHPFLLVFVGPFNSGKSSLINALLGQPDLLRVGPVPTTDRINILRYGDEPQRMDSGGEVDTVFYPSPLLRKVSFVDTPGLESIFQKHEDTTRRFLHRSDVVILVMLATQAMTSSNLEYIQQLREYGKKIIIMINQADLLSPEEAQTVRQYVLEQSQARLGFVPEVWLASARKGLEARAGGTLNETLWQESGLQQLENYVDQQLDDVERLRQKLQTPLQIIQNVNRAALESVKANQAVLDQYQSIADNVRSQLTAFRREEEKIVRDAVDEVGRKFTDTIERANKAIGESFQLSRAPGAVTAGLGEMTGLTRLFRRGKKQSRTRLAFERHRVYDPIRELPEITDKIGPRLEGKDMQDVDDLVKYAQKEINDLPPTIKDKVIGKVQSPIQYERTALQAVRPELEAVEEEARVDETEKIDAGWRNALIILGVWEFLTILTLIIVLVSGTLDFNEPSSLLVLFGLFVLAIAGLLIMPIAGRLLQAAHTNRMLKLQARYIEKLTKAADKQVAYGMQLRQDVVAPLTRLVEAQTQLQTGQLNRLQQAQQQMTAIEGEISKMGKRGLLGLRG
jgi:small GTP-binding protein